MNINIKKDARLEYLSDKIRSGEPVSVSDAIEVIHYQEWLRTERKQNTLLARNVLLLVVITCFFLSAMLTSDSLSNEEKVTICMAGYSLDSQALAKMSGDDLRDYLERTPSHGVSEMSCAEALEIERRVLR